MAWATPTTRAAGYVVPYTVWNSDAVDNPIALRAGAIALASQAIGDLIIATSSTQFGRLADVATGSVLASGGVGVAPAWSSAPALTTLELGHASDTTLSRVSAGVIAVEGNTVAMLATINFFSTAQIIAPAAVGNSYLSFRVGATNHGQVGLSGAFVGDASTHMSFSGQTGNGVYFYTDGGTTNPLIYSTTKTLAWGGGSAISSSSIVARTDIANTFAAKQTISFAGGTDFVAVLTNTTAATAYGLNIKEPAAAVAGYPSLLVSNSAGTSEWFRVDTGGAAVFGGPVSIANAAGTNELVFTGTAATNIFSATTGAMQIGTTGAGTLELRTNNTTAVTFSTAQAATFAGVIGSTVSVALTGTTNNVGTITTGVWNAGAVTSSGTVTGVAGTFSGVLSTTSSLAVAATQNLYFDGVAASGDTYMKESAANTLKTFVGGTEVVELSSGSMYIGTTGGILLAGVGGSTWNAITMAGRDNGNGASFAGSAITVGRNTNATNTAAGYIKYVSKSGTEYSVWADDTGVMRVNTAAPISTNDVAGTVIGTQTSTRASKNIYGTYASNAESLALLLATPLYDFDYKSGAMNHQRFVGITTDDSPAFGMDLGRSFNPASAFGHTVAAIKELERRLAATERELTKERRN